LWINYLSIIFVDKVDRLFIDDFLSTNSAVTNWVRELKWNFEKVDVFFIFHFTKKCDPSSFFLKSVIPKLHFTKIGLKIVFRKSQFPIPCSSYHMAFKNSKTQLWLRFSRGGPKLAHHLPFTAPTVAISPFIPMHEVSLIGGGLHCVLFFKFNYSFCNWSLFVRIKDVSSLNLFQFLLLMWIYDCPFSIVYCFCCSCPIMILFWILHLVSAIFHPF